MIENKIEEGISKAVQIYKNKFNALIEVCESPIEKLFFVDFINFYIENSISLYNVSFLSKPTSDHYGNSLSNYPTEIDNSIFVIKIPPGYIYGLLISHKFYSFSFKIIPQFEVDISDKTSYRLDFAIIGKSFSNKHKDNYAHFKIFIECDGNEFHKTPIQINNDNTRANNLKSIGWMEFRYSGKKIYSDGFCAAMEFDKYIMNHFKPFQEILDVDDADYKF